MIVEEDIGMKMKMMKDGMQEKEKRVGRIIVMEMESRAVQKSSQSGAPARQCGECVNWRVL